MPTPDRPDASQPHPPQPDPYGPPTRALPTRASRSDPPTRALPTSARRGSSLPTSSTLAARLQAARVGAWRDVRVLRFLVLWAVASPLAALLVYALLFPDEHRLDLLAGRGVDTTGVVTRVDGDQVEYRFRADSAEHTGRDTPRAPNLAATGLKAGDRLAVSYDPQQIGTSCACDPALLERPPTGWAYLAWFTVGLTAVASYIYQRELRRLGRYLARRSRELRELRLPRATAPGRVGGAGQVRDAGRTGRDQ